MDCYTHSTYAYNHAKISFGKDYIPDWWKNTPQKCPVSGKSTIKNCRAFSEYHNSGIVVPLWGELEIEISSIKENTYKWEFSNKDIDVQQHLTDQWDGFSQGKRHNFKLISPWVMKVYLSLIALITSLLTFFCKPTFLSLIPNTRLISAISTFCLALFALINS